MKKELNKIKIFSNEVGILNHWNLKARIQRQKFKYLEVSNNCCLMVGIYVKEWENAAGNFLAKYLLVNFFLCSIFPPVFFLPQKISRSSVALV